MIIRDILPYVGLIVSIISGAYIWIKGRELTELKLQHAQEIASLKHDSSELIITTKQNRLEEKLTDSLNRVEAEMRFLRDKASERHGEIQARMGNIELKVGEFTTKFKTQIDDLYRSNSLDRRTTILDNAN